MKRLYTLRDRFGVFTTSTWFPGFQTHRTYMAPWSMQTDIFIIPGVGLTVKWDWCGWEDWDYRRGRSGWVNKPELTEVQ